MSDPALPSAPLSRRLCVPAGALAAAAVALMIATAPAPAQQGPAPEQDFAGAYLAARAAMAAQHYAEAEPRLAAALRAAPGNPVLIDQLITARIGLGKVAEAVPLAQELAAWPWAPQPARLLLIADAMAAGDADAVIARLDEGEVGGVLVDGLIRAWALMGTGRMAQALAAFDSVVETPGTGSFGLYHKALALAVAGDVEGAEAILSGAVAGPLPLDRRGVIARLQILSQLGQHGPAVEIMDTAFGPELDAELEALRAALEAGEALDFTVVTDARDGTAELFFMLADVLRGDAADDYVLTFSRLAEFLRPDHVPVTLLSARLLDRMEQHELAAATFGSVDASHPLYHEARIGAAEALFAAGHEDDAIAAMQDLARTHGRFANVHVGLGDLLRRAERWDEAAAAYDDAVDRIGEPQPRHWFLFYTRAISHERGDRWPQAEADFRKALVLNPDHPHVLNYLGYSLVERRENLDEALEMIERAVEGAPDNGYITDSLGWVLYRLGRYDEAVGPMERAVELRPTDAVINDHLGDVYWAVGRFREARFQWRRALSFGPADDLDMDRIRRKLEVGLDQVLIEEGSEPHHSVTASHAN